jgi:hypothetical protein
VIDVVALAEINRGTALHLQQHIDETAAELARPAIAAAKLEADARVAAIEQAMGRRHQDHRDALDEMYRRMGVAAAEEDQTRAQLAAARREIDELRADAVLYGDLIVVRDEGLPHETRCDSRITRDGAVVRCQVSHLHRAAADEWRDGDSREIDNNHRCSPVCFDESAGEPS